MLALNFSETLPEIHTMEKYDFLKTLVHFQTTKFSISIDCSFKTSDIFSWQDVKFPKKKRKTMIFN